MVEIYHAYFFWKKCRLGVDIQINIVYNVYNIKQGGQGYVRKD